MTFTRFVKHQMFIYDYKNCLVYDYIDTVVRNSYLISHKIEKIVTTETFHIFAPYLDEKDFIVLYILVNHCSDSPGGVFFFIGELLKPSKVLIFMTTDRKPDYDSTKNL